MTEHGVKRYDLRAIAQVEHGGFWIRVLAVLIDLAILIIPIMVLERLLHAEQSLLLESAIVYGIWAAYCIPFWSGGWHGTPGKRLCGLVIVSSDGSELTLSNAAFRYLAMLVSSAIVIGPLFVAFTARRQGLHDLIADTVVVKRSALDKASRRESPNGI
ncbi:RDD family protein [Steroidobacter sp.]|uniref:RDD family protein n=1 Tax=Steroidobacter sp. TaxID=1978227 RepID=UPI001A5EF307|nr:RDD family protein [Steroidobacter sp.]MBL8267523.1 RDD family protein [Steroidobacter sp.]